MSSPANSPQQCIMKNMYGGFTFRPECADYSCITLQTMADQIPKHVHPKSKNKKRDLARFQEERQKFLRAAKIAQATHKEDL
mmetsp:Transcript_43134/g.101142  ORF Transcript_43134/g.101142 Transcript_43134/m.101142 type:complete len:82 (+) Transcript_43134:595-840(+)